MPMPTLPAASRLSLYRDVLVTATKEHRMNQASGLIGGVDFVAVPTQDYDRAAKFYGETLGLPFGKRWGNLPIAVMQSDAFGIKFSPHNHPIEFHVEDFEGAKAELESRGIEFRGDVIDSGVCLQTFFEDPDGNMLAIHHRYAPKDAKPGG